MTTAAEKIVRNRERLNGPMPDDCARLQVFRRPDGLVDGCSAMSIRGMDAQDGLCMLIRLRVLAAQLEKQVLEHFQDRDGLDPDLARSIIEEGVEMSGDHDVIERRTER